MLTLLFPQFIQMKRIETIKDLRSERARLKLELSTAEEILQEDLDWIKAELKPVHVAGKMLSNSFFNGNNGGLVNNGVRSAIDVLLKSVVLSKAGWFVKLVVPFIVKNISTNYIQEKKPEFFGMIKRLISKARSTTNNSHSHYDKSTADEMHY